MTRYLKFSELKQETCYMDLLDCHRQSWAEGRVWLGYQNEPRFSDALIFVCSDVTATFTTASGRTVPATKGNIVYIPKGERYTVSFRNGGKEVDLYTVNFCLKDPKGNRLCFEPELSVLSEHADPACQYLVSDLATAYLTFDGNKLKLQAKLFDLLDAVTDVIDYHAKDYYPIRKGAALLIKEWNKNRKTADYAAICGMSESSFYQHFKAWSGMSPNEYRTGLRLAAAKSMLRNSDLPIYKIAQQLGFEDPYYFSRIFRRLVGISPRVYRNHQS